LEIRIDLLRNNDAKLYY